MTTYKVYLRGKYDHNHSRIFSILEVISHKKQKKGGSVWMRRCPTHRGIRSAWKSPGVCGLWRRGGQGRRRPALPAPRWSAAASEEDGVRRQIGRASCRERV